MPQKDSTTDSHRAADLDYSADDAGSANGIFGWKADTRFNAFEAGEHYILVGAGLSQVR